MGVNQRGARPARELPAGMSVVQEELGLFARVSNSLDMFAQCRLKLGEIAAGERVDGDGSKGCLSFARDGTE